MPVSRYQVRNEYSLADPELYGVADRDDSEALLEGVAMAGLVGVLRQLGDLAEFAAEIFHDLHEEVMVTASRGHGLMIRVQQLEADFFSIEKAILSQTNHSRFTYNAGKKWHANLRLDQNLITRGDMPRFVMGAYEECRGLPRLFLLDKFDIAGAGACLKRYSDPSIFKTEFASSGVHSVEVKKEKKVRKVKKKGTPWWHEEPLEIFRASDFNAKLHMASNESISEKNPIHGVKLKRRHLNSSSINSRNGKSYMEHILEMYLPKSVPELHEIDMDASMKRLLYKEKNLVQSPNANRKDILEAPMVKLGENTLNSGYVEAKPIPIAKYEIEEISTTFKQVQEDVLIDGEGKIEVNADGYRLNESELEKSSPIFQFADQKDALVDRGSLTESGADEYRSEVATSELNISMESVVETETNIQVIHEPGFTVGSRMRYEQQELYAQCTDSYSVNNSSFASHAWSSSLENQESDHSDLDNISISADLHASLGNEIASLGMPENFEVLSLSEQEVLGLPHDDLCPKSAQKLKSFSRGQVAPYPFLSKIHSTSAENFSSDGNILGSESLETLKPNDSMNDVSQAPCGPDHIPQLAELPCTSCITGPTSNCAHSSLDASSSMVQLDRLDTAEFSLDPLEFNGKLSRPEEFGKQVVDGIPCPAGISNFPFGTNENAQSTKLSEICPNASSNSLLHISDILHWSHGMKDDKDIMQNVLPTENVEDCSASQMLRIKILDHISDDLPATDTFDLTSGTNVDAILEKDPMEYIEGGSGVENALLWELDSSHLMKQEPLILTKQDQDACSGETPKQTYLTNVQSSRYFLVKENGFPPSENLEYLSSAIYVQEIDSFQGEYDKRTAGSVLLEFPHSHDVELLESHVEDLQGIPSEHSGKEALSSNNQESLSNAPDNVVNDETVVEGNQINNAMKNSSLHVDLPLMPMVPNYTVEALPLDATASDMGARCIVVENDLDDHVPDPSSSQGMSGNHIEVQDACVSSKTASDISGQQSSKSFMQENFIGSENDLNPPIVGSTGPDLVPWMPDSNAPGFLDFQNHLHPTNDNSQAFMTSTESNQESELRSSHHNKTDVTVPTSFPLNPAVTSEQETATASEKVLEGHDASDLSTVSENKVEHTTECSDLRFETAPYLEKISSPHDVKEGISSPCNHEFYSFKLPKCSPDLSTSAALTPIFPAISLPMINKGFFEQQPYQAVLGSPVTGTNALEANLEEMPPPPPLPPLEWRIGKLQCGSLFLGREMMQLQSSFPQVSTTENHKAQLGFSVAQASSIALKSALVPTVTEDGLSQHILQTSFGEIPQHSKSFALKPSVEDGNPQHGFFTLGKEMVPPRCSSAPLLTVQEDEKNDKPQDSSHPAALDGESQHLLQTLVSEKPESSKLFTPLPIVKVEKPQYGSLISGDKMVTPRSSSILLPSEEEAEKDNKLHDGSLTTKGVMSQCLDLYATPPVKEVEKLQNGLLMSDGQGVHRPTAVSNLQIVEDEKPNGIVEAVAFHNRTLLRRASDRVRPEVKAKADERNSFLEQIRSKSFNLRPAAVKKPALEGPKTNLNVAAILEKANSIRQAFVGSDEDDDDGWSDS